MPALPGFRDVAVRVIQVPDVTDTLGLVALAVVVGVVQRVVQLLPYRAPRRRRAGADLARHVADIVEGHDCGASPQSLCEGLYRRLKRRYDRYYSTGLAALRRLIPERKQYLGASRAGFRLRSHWNPNTVPDTVLGRATGLFASSTVLAGEHTTRAAWVQIPAPVRATRCDPWREETARFTNLTGNTRP